MVVKKNMPKLIMRFNTMVMRRGAMFDSLQSLYEQTQVAPIPIGGKSFYYGVSKSDTRIIAITGVRNYLHSSSTNKWFNCFYGFDRTWSQATKGKILMEVSDYY